MGVHVLIGFAEALPAPEVVFSLRAAGHRVSAFAHARGHVLTRLPLEACHVIPGPETGTDAAKQALNSLMSGPNAPDLILPLDDIGLWLSHAAGIAPARVAGASGACADAALDKRLQMAAAQAAGLAVPDTVVINDAKDLEALAPGDLPAPGIAKPALAVTERAGQLGKGDVIYTDANTAPETLRGALDEAGALLIQPLVAGTGQGVFGFATAQGVTGWSGQQGVRVTSCWGGW